MFRNRVMLGVLAEALMKWMAASRSTANVCAVVKPSQFPSLILRGDCYAARGHTRSAPPRPPAPALQKT